MNNLDFIPTIISTSAIIISAIVYITTKLNDIPHLDKRINKLEEKFDKVLEKIEKILVEIAEIKSQLNDNKRDY